MNLTTFICQRRPQWRQLEEIVRQVEGSGMGSLDEETAIVFGRLYRSAASDLNQAQTFVSGDVTVQYLNDLVARCYVVIYGKTRIAPWAFLRHLLWDYPAVFRRNLGPVLLATLLLLAGAAVGFEAGRTDPMARGYLLPRDFPTIKPETEGQETAPIAASTGELAQFSSFLFANNMSVTLTAFALGITFGIGTAWLMWYNGLLLGALASEFYEADQLQAFATGVLPHGVVEIPAALLGGAAGFVLARGLIWARPWPRLQELARCGKEALLLLSGALPLLVAAAFIEAVVARAPDNYIDKGAKLAVATLVGVAFGVYLLSFGWRQRTHHDLA